jgi:acetyl-CoA acetyltransferase
MLAVRASVERAGLTDAEHNSVTTKGSLPVTTPALTINGVCGLGGQAIVSAARRILFGNMQVVLAAGMENRNFASCLIVQDRPRCRKGDGRLHNRVLRNRLSDGFARCGWQTEDFVGGYQAGRDVQER